jgi:hypothetical protein
VKALWADPSHAKDDDSTSYWQATIDGWHQDYGRKPGAVGGRWWPEQAFDDVGYGVT